LLWRLDYYGIKLPTSAKAITEYSERLYERNAFQTSLSEYERELRS